MAVSSERVFEDHAAVRGKTPLLFGLIGPSGAGKTFSALRLATGMQRVFGGEIFLVDTESDRSLHYSDRFKFRHVPFRAPFSPFDYLAALHHCMSKGARTIIVDSMSHEHEGPGGVLEWHSAEVERLMSAWRTTEEKANIPAWAKPKAARRRLINELLQMQANFIFCFRAKDKVKIGRGEVSQLGFMPIAGEEFVYELTAKALLLPGANGVPTWTSKNEGERLMIKLPEQFRGIFTGEEAKQLDETIGEQLAKWAHGGAGSAFAEEYETCADKAAFDALEVRRAELWPKTGAADKKLIKAAVDAAAKRVAEAPAQKRPAPELTLDGNPPDREAAAITSLEAAFKDGILRAAWAKVVAGYDALGAEIPLDVEAKYQELRDAAGDQP
jgi:ABC-type cobalamin/Fe3+-siderophores transport system ATPase subunit